MNKEQLDLFLQQYKEIELKAKQIAIKIFEKQNLRRTPKTVKEFRNGFTLGDKNIELEYYEGDGEDGYEEIPIDYLLDDNWEEKYDDKRQKEIQKVKEDQDKRDKDEQERLRKLEYAQYIKLKDKFDRGVKI